MRKESKNSRSFFLTLAVIAVIGYFVFSLISLQIDIKDKSSQIDDANQTLSEIKSENEELKGYLKDEDESSYIESVARDVLGYVFTGERVYYDISTGE